MDIYIDDVEVATWTSSGLTTDFESVELGAIGQKIELRGVLGNAEWISITEVGGKIDGSWISGMMTVPTSCVSTMPVLDLPMDGCST